MTAPIGAPHTIAQAKPAAGVLQRLYVAQTNRSCSITALTACNQVANVAQIRVAVRSANLPLDEKHWIYYDLAVAPNNTFAVNFEKNGIALGPADAIDVYSDIGSCSFTIFGTENHLPTA